MTKKEEQALLIFERKIFRRIMYGPKYEDGEWKSRTNRELEESSKGENIVKWIKGQRISWLGHLERMEENRMPKKIFIQELEGMRRRGRPRKGWREEAERDNNNNNIYLLQLGCHPVAVVDLHSVVQYKWYY
jgi:hypothetical protein